MEFFNLIDNFDFISGSLLNPVIVQPDEFLSAEVSITRTEVDEKVTLNTECVIQSKSQRITIHDGLFRSFMSALGINKSAFLALTQGLESGDAMMTGLLIKLIKPNSDRIVYYAVDPTLAEIDCVDIHIFSSPVIFKEETTILGRLLPIKDAASPKLECAMLSELGATDLRLMFREGSVGEFNPMVLVKAKVSNPDSLSSYGAIQDVERGLTYILPRNYKTEDIEGIFISMSDHINKLCLEHAVTEDYNKLLQSHLPKTLLDFLDKMLFVGTTLGEYLDLSKQSLVDAKPRVVGLMEIFLGNLVALSLVGCDHCHLMDINEI